MKQGVIKMCKQAVVLDTLKKTAKKGGMTAAQIKLAEAQSEDYAEMKKEIQEVKSEVTDVKEAIGILQTRFAELQGKIDIILKNSEQKETLLSNKYFWITVMVGLCLFAGVTHLKEILTLLGG